MGKVAAPEQPIGSTVGVVNYRDAYAYKEEDYGYGGYIDRGDYNNYFRDGFRPGYETGYNGVSRNGQNTDGKDSMWDNILSEILKLELLR